MLSRQVAVMALILVCAIFATGGQVSAAPTLYTDVSLHYYNEFFTPQSSWVQAGFGTRNFQRYHVLSQGYHTDRFDISFSFNLLEAVDGPMADHTLTPYTIQATYQLGPYTLKTDLLDLVDVYDKTDSQRALNTRLSLEREWNLGRVSVGMAPIVTYTQERSVSLHPQESQSQLAAYATVWLSTHIKSTQVTIAYNDLDAKDQLLLGSPEVLSASIHWPTWAGNSMCIGLHTNLAAGGRPGTWVDISLFFDHLFAVEF